jgi:hypothetical protein
VDEFSDEDCDATSATSEAQ